MKVSLNPVLYIKSYKHGDGANFKIVTHKFHIDGFYPGSYYTHKNTINMYINL
jgi:hypothetical protein